jgi:hypothetical protein
MGRAGCPALAGGQEFAAFGAFAHNFWFAFEGFAHGGKRRAGTFRSLHPATLTQLCS